MQTKESFKSLPAAILKGVAANLAITKSFFLTPIISPLNLQKKTSTVNMLLNNLITEK